MITISMIDANSFIETVMLDDTAYRLRFNWNDSAGQWTMDICSNSNEDIIRGISVVPNFPLLNQYRRHSGIPGGEILAISNDLLVKSIGRDGFVSGLFRLVYVPEVELNDIVESTVSA